MKVILGCDPLLHRLSGIGVYTLELGNALKNIKEIDDLKLFAHGVFFSHRLLDREQHYNVSDSQKLAEKGGLSHFSKKVREALGHSKLAVSLYSWVFEYIMMRRLKSCSEHIFHSTNFLLPKFDGKTVVTIHDLSTIKFPEFHPQSRVDLVNTAIINAIENADKIVTVSEYVRREILELYDVDEGKIVTIPLAADPGFYPRTENQYASLLKLNSIEHNEFFLFVSTLEPRKNLLRILDAYKQYAKQSSKIYPLVIVGSSGWDNLVMRQVIQELSNLGVLRHLGYITRSELQILMSSARALVFPSLYEGFGLPVLEAMQSQTAVLTSFDSSMSEICEKNAVLVDPNKTEDIAEGLLALGQNDHLVEDLASNGLRIAKKYSWNLVAERTANIYRELALQRDTS
jgi:alpha-1,3-rhamnosyl/mannosyltransferase